MDRNPHDRVDIYVQRSKMDLSAVVDVAPLNHVNSLSIIGSIGKLAGFVDILEIIRDRK
jgi:hypothetical protein